MKNLKIQMKTQKNKEKGITLIALIITIVVLLVSYDKNIKYRNLVGFSL